MTGLERKNHPHLSYCIDRMNNCARKELQKTFDVKRVYCNFSVTKDGISIFTGNEIEVAAFMEGYVSGFNAAQTKNR